MSTVPEDGGPAFPEVLSEMYTDVNDNRSMRVFSDGGMTLADYFAAKAMQAILASMKPEHVLFYKEKGPQLTAEASYNIADVMLAVREQRRKKTTP